MGKITIGVKQEHSCLSEEAEKDSRAEGVEKDRNSIYLLNPAAPITGEPKYNGLHDNSGDHRLQAASEQ